MKVQTDKKVGEIDPNGIDNNEPLFYHTSIICESYMYRYMIAINCIRISVFNLIVG